MAKRRTTRRKKKNRESSGFLFLLTILILLGIGIYYKRDHFLALTQTMISTGVKNHHDKKLGKKEKEQKELFAFIDDIENKFRSSKKKNEATQKPDFIIEEDFEKTEEVSEKKKPLPVVKKETPKPSTSQKTIVKSKPVQQKKAVVVTKPKTKPAVKQAKPKQKVTITKKEPLKSKPKVQSKKTTVASKPEKKKTITAKEENNARKSVISTKPKVYNKTRKVYFSRFNEDESQKLVATYRNVQYTDSPLTETLKVLLRGPTSAETSNGLLTNVPDNTSLRRVFIKNSIAYIDLSKAFEYNQYGRESMLLQLKQIVYTATEFGNIKGVQFLIDGQVKSYLGGDGISIGTPLTRNDFS